MKRTTTTRFAAHAEKKRRRREAVEGQEAEAAADRAAGSEGNTK